ncbi:alpha/beta fold hydrolase [Psychroserpens sp. SPM9]|uniref:alpha/beta fold hydrolase n=1 Tax=Psychroserpens sp. SPM9 TaxID=2975598 RepID=UPI0021A802F9|nr:alpha/beta hydrolase [Psychroserpens sp. SPM9]MDG5490934.1 alpha/beta hydrolase [Psychroserpens sp. SPM9]
MILHYKGIPVHYTDEGEGTVVVLLHGFLENLTMWNALKPTLLENHRIICVDLLGHGQTECLGYIHTMNDMAQAVLEVLQHLTIRAYTLIGHSMGGYVALALAEMNPVSVSGLCLMNSTYYADDEERKVLRRRANTMVQTNYEAMVRMSFTNLFSPESKITHKKELDEALAQALQTPLQGYMAAQEGMCIRDDKFDFFKSLNTKKAIIIGEQDPVVDGARILKETQDTSIICYELSFGHMSHIENKSELSYIIKHFVE